MGILTHGKIPSSPFEFDGIWVSIMRFHQEDDGDSDEDNQDGVIMVTSAHCFGGCDQD